MSEVHFFDHSDSDLLAQARGRGDSREADMAMAVLLKRYQGRIFQWCLAHVGDRETALDMTQEVLVRVYQHLGEFQERSRFTSWLFAIARNQCLSRLRRPDLLREEADPVEEPTRPDESPERIYESKEEEERLRRLLARHLEPAEQEAIWLRCFECMPVDEITSTLGLTSATGARGVLQSARRKLRVVLAREKGREGE